MLIVITVEKKVEADSVVSSSLMLGLLATLFNVQTVFSFLYNRDGKTSPEEKERKSLTTP